MFTYDDPIFSQPDALRFTRPSAATLDNWLRYEHVPTIRGDNGRRIFAFRHLLMIDAIEMLVDLFSIPPGVAARFGAKAADDYQHWFEVDLAQIRAGASPHAGPRGDSHFTIARNGDEVVELEDGNDHPEGVMLVFPTRNLARRVMAAIVADDSAKAEKE